MKIKERLQQLETQIGGPLAQALMKLLSELKTQWDNAEQQRDVRARLARDQRIDSRHETSRYSLETEKLLLEEVSSFIRGLRLNVSVMLANEKMITQAVYSLKPEHEYAGQEGTMRYVTSDAPVRLSTSEESGLFSPIQAAIISGNYQPAQMMIHVQLAGLDRRRCSQEEKQVIASRLMELSGLLNEAIAEKVAHPDASRVLLAEAVKEYCRAIHMYLYAQPLHYHRQSEQIKKVQSLLLAIGTPSLVQAAEEIQEAYFDENGQPRRMVLVESRMPEKPGLN